MKHLRGRLGKGKGEGAEGRGGEGGGGGGKLDCCKKRVVWHNKV